MKYQNNKNIFNITIDLESIEKNDRLKIIRVFLLPSVNQPHILLNQPHLVIN